MTRAIADLIHALTMIVPMRVVVVITVILAISAAPYWVESMRDRQLRGLVRRCVRAEEPHRDTLVSEILRLAADKPNRLRTVVQVAVRYDQRDVRDQALAALEATGKADQDVKLLRAHVEKPPIQFRDPLEAAIRIEHLLDAGLDVGAREQLDAALKAFPDDPELEALRTRAG